jgi:hypothetical protein
VSPAVSQASSAIQSRIVNYARAHQGEHTFGSYVDQASGKVVIETDAPSNVVSSLVGSFGAQVKVRKQTISEHFSRRDDIAPFWGGAGITLTAPNPRCSAGYTVRNAVGTLFMVTAGHCFSNGQTAVTELGGRVVGTVSGNGLPSQDMELIGGQSYSPFIYTGGVNSSTGAHWTVDVVLDNVGGRQLVAAWDLLAPGGCVQSIGWASGEPAVFAPYATVGPAKSLTSFLIQGVAGAELATLVQLLGQGRLTVDIGWRGPWQQAAEAAKALREHRVNGKAILDVAPAAKLA